MKKVKRGILSSRVTTVGIPSEGTLNEITFACRRCGRHDKFVLTMRWNYCINCSTRNEERWVVVVRLPCALAAVRETGMKR